MKQIILFYWFNDHAILSCIQCWHCVCVAKQCAAEVWWLTHWGRVTHICVGKLTIIGSDNGLSPRRRQAIIWTNDGILLIGPLETNFNEILIEIYTFSFKKMHLKMLSGKWRPFCLGLNVLTTGLDSNFTWMEWIRILSPPRLSVTIRCCIHHGSEWSTWTKHHLAFLILSIFCSPNNGFGCWCLVTWPLEPLFDTMSIDRRTIAWGQWILTWLTAYIRWEIFKGNIVWRTLWSSTVCLQFTYYRYILLYSAMLL